jgi:hypothetical protein
MLVRLLLDTIPLLGSVMVLCLFLFATFGIMGVQLFKGVLSTGCFNDNNEIYKPEGRAYYICSTSGSGMNTCPPPATDELNTTANYTTCKQEMNVPNFQHGAVSFDNIFMAFIAVFQVITLEDWSELMYALQDGYSYWVWPFFVLLILLGSWFAINLALVVIATQFKVTKKREAQLLLESQEIAKANKVPKRSYWRECVASVVALVTCGRSTIADEPQGPAPIRATFTDKMTEDEKVDLQMIQEVFDLLDQDRDGTISVGELRAALQVLDSHLPKAELKALADSIDVDGDGMIDFEEFRVLMGYDGASSTSTDKGALQALESGSSPPTLHEISTNRKRIQAIVAHKGFTWAVVVCIGINTVSMAFEHHGQPEELTSFIEWTNGFFAYIFLIEVILRVVSVGPKAYFIQGFNVCDAAIVVMGCLEVFVTSGSLSSLRSFRLLRMFKLARYLPTMQSQLTVMMKSLDSVMTFLLLLFLFIFMFAIMGMHLFGGRLDVATNSTIVSISSQSRSNFDSFPSSVIAVFQVLTTEEWNIMMYHVMHSTSFTAAIYFIILIFVGTYILVNLFVAIMVEGFATDPEAIERFKAAVERARAMFNIQETAIEEEEEEDYEECEDDFLEENAIRGESTHANSCCSPLPLSICCCFGGKQNRVDIVKEDVSNEDQTMDEEEAHGLTQTIDTEGHIVVPNVIDTTKYPWGSGDDAQLEAPVQNTLKKPHLLGSKKDGSFKTACKRFLLSRKCHWVIVTFLTLDALALSLERPAIKDHSAERIVLEVIDCLCETIFTGEMILKMTTFGVTRGPDAYLKNVWNVFDFTLLLTSWPRMIMTFSGMQGSTILTVFRMYRTIRPFRIIPRVPPVQQTLHMLYVSVRPIGNLLLVGAVFYIIFAILGVQMFKGKMYFCDIDEVETNLPYICTAVDGYYNSSSGCSIEPYLVRTQADCIGGGGAWGRRHYHFDNVVSATLTLFLVSSRDGWIEIMQNGMDSAGVELHPVKNSNMISVVYFVSFLLIVGYFVISMFVGVIVENFQLSMPPVESIDELEEELCEDDANTMENKIVHDSKIRQWAYRLMHHKHFEVLMAVLIFLNVLIMAVEHLDQSDAITAFLTASNYIFTGVYIVEMVIKITGVGFGIYFQSSWNRFDSFVVLTSLIGVMFRGQALMSNSSTLQALRILRVARILKLMKVATGLASLLTTVWSSMPQVMSMGLILLILFLSAAALGIEMFGKIEFDVTSPSTGISTHANFQHAGLAGLTLFRIATGDNWVGVMRDALDTDIPRVFSVSYFVFFVITAQFVLLNVVVAVLMKNLTAALQWVDIDDDEDIAATDGANTNDDGTDEISRDSVSSGQAVDVNNHANLAVTSVTETLKGGQSKPNVAPAVDPQPRHSISALVSEFSIANEEKQNTTTDSKASGFLQPPENVHHLMETLQERADRASLNSQSQAPTETLGRADRNRRALKASLHLVMAMVKMSNVVETEETFHPTEGTRGRLSIVRHSVQGRTSMMMQPQGRRSTVNSKASVLSATSHRNSARTSVNRASQRVSLTSRTSTRSSVMRVSHASGRPSNSSHRPSNLSDRGNSLIHSKQPNTAWPPRSTLVVSVIDEVDCHS